MSNPATVPLVQVWDQEYAGGGSATTAPAISGRKVKAQLSFAQATYSNPVVGIATDPVSTTTDANGYWTMYLAANDLINPSGTLWAIQVEGEPTYLINVISTGVPVGGWQSSAIVVNTPAALGSTSFNIPGGATVNGAFTITGLLTTLSATISSVLNAVTARFKTSPWHDITHPDYGAVTGQDCTAAINLAITACANGGTIFFPDGTWNHTGWALNWASVDSKAIRFLGSSRSTCILQHTGTGIGFDFDRCHGVTIENMTIKAGANTTIAVRINAFRPKMSSVEVDGTAAGAGAVGLELRDSPTINTGTYYGEFTRVWVHNFNGSNWRLKTYLNGGAVATVNANKFEVCQSTAGGSHGWELVSAQGNKWSGGDSESNGGYGFSITAGAYTRLVGTWIESNSSGPANFVAGTGNDQAGIFWVPISTTATPTGINNLGNGSFVWDQSTNPASLRLANSQLLFGPANAVWDVALSRVGTTTLGLNNFAAFRTGIEPTASLPAAASLPQGAMVYDSTLDRLKISTGSAYTLMPVKHSETIGIGQGDHDAGLRPTGVLRETFVRDFITNQALTAPVKDNVVYGAIQLGQGDIITNVGFMSGSTGLTTSGTAPHFWFALYDSTGAIIRQSTDDLAATWGGQTVKTKAIDSIPTTAGARSGTSIVTLTVPTLSQALTSLIATADSVTISNANVAAYNGTFAVTGVTATTITYDCTVVGTDSLAGPFPTIQLAAGKRTYTAPTSGLYYIGMQVDSGSTGTQPTLAGVNLANATVAGGTTATLPVLSGRDTTTSVTGTAVALSVVAARANANRAYGYVS